MKFIITFLCLILTACSISFQNVDTHGTASDLIDENQSEAPTISPNLTLPAFKI